MLNHDIHLDHLLMVSAPLSHNTNFRDCVSAVCSAPLRLAFRLGSGSWSALCAATAQTPLSPSPTRAHHNRPRAYPRLARRSQVTLTFPLQEFGQCLAEGSTSFPVCESDLGTHQYEVLVWRGAACVALDLGFKQMNWGKQKPRRLKKTSGRGRL